MYPEFAAQAQTDVLDQLKAVNAATGQYPDTEAISQSLDIPIEYVERALNQLEAMQIVQRIEVAEHTYRLVVGVTA